MALNWNKISNNLPDVRQCRTFAKFLFGPGQQMRVWNWKFPLWPKVSTCLNTRVTSIIVDDSLLDCFIHNFPRPLFASSEWDLPLRAVILGWFHCKLSFCVQIKYAEACIGGATAARRASANQSSSGCARTSDGTVVDDRIVKWKQRQEISVYYGICVGCAGWGGGGGVKRGSRIGSHV